MIAVPNKDKKRSYSVIDETTGEVVETISRRQYDKRFGVLAKEGFNSYEARNKAEKYRVEGPFKFSHTIHHVYDIGIPNDLTKAIETTIRKSPHFGTKMMLAVFVEVYGDGSPYKRWIGTTVWKKQPSDISGMLDDLDEQLADYDIE